MTSTLDRYGLVDLSNVSEQAHEMHGPLIEALNDDLHSVLSNAEQRAKAIRVGGKLTISGQTEELKKLSTSAHAELEKAATRRRPALEATLRTYNVPSRPPSIAELASKRKVDPVSLTLQHQEIRNALREVDPTQLRALLWSAAQDADVDAIAAAVSCHPTVSPLKNDPGLAQEIKEMWIDANTPKEAKGTREAIATHDGNVATARKFLTDLF